MGVGVDLLDDAGVEAGAGREHEPALVERADVHPSGLPVVGHQQQVLGGVDHVGRDPEHPAVHVGAAAGEAAERRV